MTTLIRMTGTAAPSPTMGKDRSSCVVIRLFKLSSIPNMFSMVRRKPHADRKRMIASLYSNSTLQSSPELRKISQTILMERLLPIIEAASKDQDPVDALELSLAVSMDFITAYIFGLLSGSNFFARREGPQAMAGSDS